MSSESYDSDGYSDQEGISKAEGVPLKGKFFDMIRSHFSEMENFLAYDHILQVRGLDKWGRIDEIDISKILPGAKLICREEINNIGYHSRECEAQKVELYSYNGKYIVFNYDLYACGIESDLDILSIDHHYGGSTQLKEQLQALFNDMVEVVDQIECEEFIRNNNIMEITHIIDLFHGVHGENEYEEFEQYMKKRYTDRLGHQR